MKSPFHNAIPPREILNDLYIRKRCRPEERSHRRARILEKCSLREVQRYRAARGAEGYPAQVAHPPSLTRWHHAANARST